MKRFVVAAVIAGAASLTATETASAQIVYNYTRPAPGGLVNGGVAIGPTAATSWPRRNRRPAYWRLARLQAS